MFSNLSHFKLLKNAEVKTSGDVVIYKFPIEQGFPLHWLANQDSKIKVYLKLRDSSEEYAGIGDLLRHRDSNLNTLSWELTDYEKFIKKMDDSEINLFGGVSFNGQRPKAPWKNFEKTRLVLPEFEIRQNHNGAELIARKWDFTDEDEFIQKLASLNSENIPLITHPRNNPKTLKDTPSHYEWDTIFNDAKNLLKNNFTKIVLARESRLKFNLPVNPFSTLSSLKGNTYKFLFQFDEEEQFLGSSPEKLFRYSNNILETESLAGTISASKDQNKDESLKLKLSSSTKDLDEHAIVLEQIVESLKEYSLSHEVKSRKVESLKNLHHLKTPLEFNLKKDTKVSSLINSIHPTPAVGGHPKEGSVSWLSQNEPICRGWYAAPVGIMNTRFSEWTVAIRSALLRMPEIYLYSGVGIVSASDSKLEWDELNTKISDFLEIFGQPEKVEP